MDSKKSLRRRRPVKSTAHEASFSATLTCQSPHSGFVPSDAFVDSGSAIEPRVWASICHAVAVENGVLRWRWTVTNQQGTTVLDLEATLAPERVGG